jgi:hypothetical protein
MNGAFGRFLAGPIGSAARIALGLVLGSYVSSLQSGAGLVPSLNSVYTWLGAAVAVALPIIIAALNPQDPRFGSGS